MKQIIILRYLIVIQTVTTLLYIILQRYYNIYYIKLQRNDFFYTENEYIRDLLFLQHPRRLKNVFRIFFYVFAELKDCLIRQGFFKKARIIFNTEKLAIFLFLANHGWF